MVFLGFAIGILHFKWKSAIWLNRGQENRGVTLQLRGVYEDKELRNLMRFGG